MEFSEEKSAAGGRYVTVVDGHEAEMHYSRASEKLIIIDHTGVPDALRGLGVGVALAEHAVAEARAGGWKIFPLCPFFKAQSLKHAEWDDVISGGPVRKQA
ncbi:N-acetyltransferase [Martelella alba]|uniref:N-acetyltransferase n=1 Tax=Martelella alba TaxID=2590451 RepID=A0A506UDL5_9HYPH|nr:GNAT family N-acetyltransferase [Martelella alba]TPW31496.1 N-acetyltransferase [Martelella alba]